MDSTDNPADLSTPPEPRLVEILRRLEAVERDLADVRGELAVRGERSFAGQLVKLVAASGAVIAAATVAFPHLVDVLGGSESRLLFVWTFFNAAWVPLSLTIHRELTAPASRLGRSAHRFLALDVPPEKETLARNRYLDGAAIFYLTWGLLILFPIMLAVSRIGYPNLAFLDPLSTRVGRLQPGDDPVKVDFAEAWTVYLIGLVVVVAVAMARWARSRRIPANRNAAAGTRSPRSTRRFPIPGADDAG